MPKPQTPTSPPTDPAAIRGSMAPGDEAPPGTPGTGQDICRACKGSGRLSDGPCPECGGTGIVIEGIGGG